MRQNIYFDSCNNDMYLPDLMKWEKQNAFTFSIGKYWSGHCETSLQGRLQGESTFKI